MPLPPGYEYTEKANQMTSTVGQFRDYAPPTREEMQYDKENDPTAEWDWQNEAMLGPQGEALPKYAEGWQPNGNADFGSGLSGWWKKAKSKVETAYETGMEEGLRISKLDKMNYAYDTPEEQARLKDERASKAGVVTATAEAAKEVFNQALWGVLDLLSVPAKVIEKGIGAVGRTVGEGIELNENFDDQLKRNYQASELAYSAIFDMSIYAEMERRIDAGIRPDLAAQEIMIDKQWTLWPELIGQGVLDPLNFITVSTKAGAQIKMAKNAQKTFHEVSNPAVAQLLEDVSKLDDAQAYRKIEELVKTQQGLKTVTSHADDIAQSGKDLEALSKSYKLASMTADGKIAHVANQTSEILMHVVNNSDPSEALEIIRGMVRSVSDNVDEAAEGIATMMHFADAPALFSEAGNTTTVMLSKMMEKYGATWLDDIAKLQGNPSELTRSLLTKLDDIGEEVFPSVSAMLKAEDEVKAIKAGVEVTEKTKALAQRAKELPEYVRAATRFHDAAQKVVGPINRFFVGTYMGWSPGFAFRNFSNNSLQLLVDYGPGVLLGKADDVFAKAEKLHGGILQGAFSEGGQAAALFPDAIKAGANARDTGVKAVVEAVKQKGLKGPVLAASQVAEANAAKRIIAKTYTETFERGTKAMVKALTPDLKAAGFSDDIIKKLPTYITQNDGDAAKVINALRNDIKAGAIDLFNDVSRIDPQYKKFLETTGKWSEYSENVLRAASPEAATQAAKKIFDDLAEAGDYVYREARPAVDNYDKFLKMAEKNGLPSTRGELVSLRKTESRKAIQAAEAILAEADNAGAKLGLPVGDMKKAKKITGLNTWGNDAAKEADRINDIAWKVTKDAKSGKADLKALWNAFPELFPGTPPSVLDQHTFLETVWARYDEVTSAVWGGARDSAIDNVTGYLDDLKAAGAPVKDEWYDVIKEAQEGAQQYDNAVIGMHGEKWVETTKVAAGTRATKIAEIAQKYGIATATETGIALDKKILNIINKYGDTDFKSLNDPIAIDLVEEALSKKAGKLAGNSQPAALEGGISLTDATRDPLKPYYDDAGNLVQPKRASKRILPPAADGTAPPISRAIYEQGDTVTEIRKWMMDDIAKNFGKKQLIDKSAEQGLKVAEKELTQKLAENRLISSRVAQANRDFTLLNYGEKSYWDTALAYLYPFHYWYKGTYKNWVTRIAQNPSVLANYSRYKENLGTIHAGMPEWWKYNINTNDLPGVDVDNPLYFNLEATLWPLNGITGMDFNDNSKNVNWWTQTLSFMNKFGPSTWAPLSIATGLALHQKGENDAGDKWMGRLIPQSNVIKAAGSLFGIANLETDPFVGFLQGGLDPYERRRAQRALASMMQDVEDGNSPYTKEQIQDAAYSQKGEIWEQAVKQSTRARAPSTVSSFLFGVGFKGRTEQDMEIDKFYTDYGKLWNMRPNLSPQEFSEGMEKLKDTYPFMDTVMLSKGSGVERDAGLAYNVLTRIPPGKTSDIAKAVGISPELLEKFFNDKGQIDQWNKADYNRLMAGVLDISAILEVPSDMTRKEWLSAKNTYKTAMEDAKTQFGDDIWDKVDGYYQAKTKSYEAADAYLQKHPEVQQALDWKSERVMQSPLLSAYYGGANVIESYYRSQMYSDIEKQMGKEVFELVNEYNDIKTYGTPAEIKQFYNQNKAEIKQYYALRDQWQATIDQNVVQLASQIPEAEGATIRPDADLSSLGAQDLAQSLQPEQQMTFEDFQAVVPTHTMNIVQDYLESGEKITESAQKQLERLARELGYADATDLIQAIGVSMYQP